MADKKLKNEEFLTTVATSFSRNFEEIFAHRFDLLQEFECTQKIDSPIKPHKFQILTDSVSLKKILRMSWKNVSGVELKNIRLNITASNSTTEWHIRNIELDVTENTAGLTEKYGIIIPDQAERCTVEISYVGLADGLFWDKSGEFFGFFIGGQDGIFLTDKEGNRIIETKSIPRSKKKSFGKPIIILAAIIVTMVCIGISVKSLSNFYITSSATVTTAKTLGAIVRTSTNKVTVATRKTTVKTVATSNSSIRPALATTSTTKTTTATTKATTTMSKVTTATTKATTTTSKVTTATTKAAATTSKVTTATTKAAATTSKTTTATTKATTKASTNITTPSLTYPSAENVFIEAGYDLANYTKLDLEPTLYKYYNSGSSDTLQGTGTDADATSKKFWATAKFTKDQIPNGSVIVVAEGYQYRPEGWAYTGTRPGNFTTTITVVDDAWWGTYTTRGFNIGAVAGTQVTEDEYGVFAIYIPKNNTESLEFTSNDDGTYYVSGIGNYTNSCLVIPSSYNGNSVIGISENAFKNCINLTSVVIPDSITSIGEGAFSGCYKLTEVINHSALEITPESTSNGYVAYYAKEVHTGESKIIEKDDFVYYPFDNTYYLVNYNGSSKEIVLPENYNGSSYIINKYAFYNRSDIISVTISAGVESIENNAFYGCSGLTEISLPDSVTSIGSGVFSGCSGLTDVTLSSNLTEIPANAFKNCTKLTKIEIPYGVTSINGNILFGGAFYGCSNLKSIKIPSSVTTIRQFSFALCNNLNAIDYDGTMEQWQNISFGNYWNTSAADSKIYCTDGVITKSGEIIIESQDLEFESNGDGTCTLVGIGNCADDNIVIPYKYNGETVSTIGDSAFKDCDRLHSITIPDSVTKIGNNAFRNCTNLNSVVIADSVTSIGLYAFYGCTGLTSINIPDGISVIGYGVFYGCSNLVRVIIPNSVTTIQGKLLTIAIGAFYSCSNLTEVQYNGTIEQWQAISLGTGWDDSTGDYTVYCTDGTISKSGTVTYN